MMIEAPTEWMNKGLGAPPASTAATPDWNLLREDLSLPVAVLDEPRMAHNLRWMQQFIEAYGVRLAPHGKTTMAPKLFQRQLAGGAWGITLATAPQTRIAHAHGVHRVLMANQLVGRENMAIIARLLAEPKFEYFCLVDSVRNVEQLGEFFRTQKQRLHVLIELGPEGGRTGVRNRDQLAALLDELDRWKDWLALAGVEVYEGVLPDEPAVRAFLQRAVATTEELVHAGRFARTPAILSGAGSAWYDVVAEVFAPAQQSLPIEVVLRPGCYLTHDVGIYRAAQQQILERNPVARQMHSSLQPALQLWAYVQSVPEPRCAIIALGKRDAAFDAGLPTPVLRYRPGNSHPLAAPAHWNLTKMMDQHAYLEIAEDDDIEVGDMIGFDISHPCLTFDKWRTLPVLDENYQVIDVVETFF
jgi:D-serine dehydratase